MTAHVSKPQYRLGDDVPLDLVRAAVDRDLAPVEIGRRDGAGPVGADRRLVLAVLGLVLVGQGVGTDHLHQELGRRLLDLRALDLEDRRGRIRLALLAMALGGDDAQLRHLQRLELDLDRGELLAKAGRLDQRHLADALEPGELLDAAQALLRDADAGDADALVAEQELGVVPALVLLPDEVLGRHAHVVEEDLVDLLAAVDGADRAHRDAGRLHVDEEEGDALLLLYRHVGAGEHEDPVGVLPERRPGLLAGDDVLVAVALCRRLERGEVGAGAGLGEALAPPVVEIGDARQEAALLRLRAEGDDDRADHADAERQRRGRRRLLHLVLEDVLPHRIPAGAAPFDRPMRHRPALGVEDARPFDELVLRGMVAHDELVADARRQRGAEEFAHVLAEGGLLGGEAEVHAGAPFLVQCCLTTRVVPGEAQRRPGTHSRAPALWIPALRFASAGMTRKRMEQELMKPPASAPSRAPPRRAPSSRACRRRCAGGGRGCRAPGTASRRRRRKSAETRVVAFSCNSTKANFEVRSMATNRWSLPCSVRTSAMSIWK